MALPPDNSTDKVKVVEDAIKNMASKDLAALPDLDGEDLQLFGTLIQQPKNT
jgi:hypothetical protein